MKTVHPFLVWGLILVILSVAGCEQESVEPNNHFFRTYETTPVPAFGLDAIPVPGGYVLLAQTYNVQYEDVWERSSPLFIPVNEMGDINYTNFWENYNRTERFAQPYPYILSTIGDTVVRTIGYHRKDARVNDKGCFISFNTVKNIVDTCWENCPAWNVTAAAGGLLGAVRLHDGTAVVAQKSGDGNIKFVSFDKSGASSKENIYSEIYHQYKVSVINNYSRKNMYFTDENNFFRMKQNSSGIHILASDGIAGDCMLFWFPPSLEGEVGILDSYLPESDWAETDSIPMLMSFSLNSAKKELNIVLTNKEDNILYTVKKFTDVYYYKTYDFDNFTYLSVYDYYGNLELYKIYKKDVKFSEMLKAYSRYVWEGEEDIKSLTLNPVKIFEQKSGKIMEINAVRELEGTSSGTKDLLICGSIYTQPGNPRPFLMRVDENGNY